jgi:CRP-like cAMP-binding protein
MRLACNRRQVGKGSAVDSRSGILWPFDSHRIGTARRMCCARLGNTFGGAMEHQLVLGDAAPEQDALGPDRAGQRFSRMGCVLPLGIPAACGDARHRINLPANSEVLLGGRPERHVWFVRTGILRLQRYAVDGRRQILSLFLPGDIPGYNSPLRDGVSVETAMQSGLCRIDKPRFEMMLGKDRQLLTEICRQQQDQLDRLHWLTWSLGALGPEERLCAFLALSCRFMPYQPPPDGTGVLSMQLSRTDIADLLGTTVESISRIVRRLDDAGIIAIVDPAHFRILDLKALTTMGKIADRFDRMTQGLVARRDRMARLTGPAADSPVCLCGR